MPIMSVERFDVCVLGGCGHAGLPLSIAFALRGKRVVVVDADEERAQQVRAGVMPFLEEHGQEGLQRVLASHHLVVGDEPQAVAQSDAVILVVGTPIDGHLAPSFRGIEAVLQANRPYLCDDQLLVLRSTLYPGTSERVARWADENGLNLHIAVCPERIVEGVALREIFSLPQIIAAFSPEGLERTRALFRALTEDLVVMEPLEAELAKLFTNAWRYIKFAAANQFFMIANDFGADFDRIFGGIKHNYPRAQDLPAPGFSAGPCLFKDTMQLSAFTNNEFFLGHAAMLVNEGLPFHVVAHLRQRYGLRSATVGILGMAYKADVDDGRDSLSFKLKDLLEMHAQRVLCSDPYLQRAGFVEADEVLARADLIIIATPHGCYRTLDFGAKPVIDIWNILGRGIRL
jgi:UDP-N-acetyl-D-mannosaminuronic acid dehydrogenase